jgi:hypothetical protein
MGVWRWMRHSIICVVGELLTGRAMRPGSLMHCHIPITISYGKVKQYFNTG